VGKSRLAHATLPEAYVKEPRTKWWNGYLCQSDVIIDDFGPNGIDITIYLDGLIDTSVWWRIRRYGSLACYQLHCN